MVRNGRVPPGVDRLAVWAFEMERYEVGRGIRVDEPRDSGVRIVRSPRAGNPNLHAQRGFHTFVPIDSYMMDDPIDPFPLDIIVTEHLHKVTLPIEVAPTLLFALSRFGITAASVFPGLRGVTDALAERRLWKSMYFGKVPPVP